MIEPEFPEFYSKSDSYSGRWQQRYLWAERVQLVALIGAALLAALDSPPGLVVLAFAVGICAQVFRLVSKADQRWWNGRAGAESAKTLSWKFIVGGNPFAVGASSVESAFATTIKEIALGVAKLTPIAVGESQVTAAMREVRSRPLQERIDLYRQVRIRGQLEWYAEKSDFNGRRATRWSFAALGAQALGLLIGIAAVMQDSGFDYVGVFSSLAAGAVAWMAVKQHEVLNRSYAVASSELSVIDARIADGSPWSEEEWAPFVDDAEEAISREHTSWRASRGV